MANHIKVPLDPVVVATSIPQDIGGLPGRSSRSLESPVSEKDSAKARDVEAAVHGGGHARDPNLVRPTEEERATLRKVSDKIPVVSYALCFVEFAERASYYGVRSVFSNFMQFGLPVGGNGAGAPPRHTQKTAGALNKGLQFSSAFVLLFSFLSYVTPLLGAWIADTRIGRYKTIAIGVLICGISHIIMIFGALPSVLQAGHGVAPFVISFFILAFGAGLFKPNIAPTVIDQYQHQYEFVKVLKSGEKVIVDPETTIQRMMLVFYALTNVGAFYGLPTTYAEKYVGFWLAFLLPGIIYFLLPILLWLNYKKTVKIPPSKSAYDSVYSIIWIALKKNGWRLFRKGFWDPARPSVMRANGILEYKGKTIAWDDKLVDDVHRTFSACQVFLYFIVWNLNDGGIGSVLSSQGSTMTTNGAPNDLLGKFNPLTIIVTIPILNYIIYPLLRRYKIPFGRITRITTGFTLATISGVIGAIIQWRIYKSSPCGYHATGCKIGTGVSPLSIWLQVPTVSLGAISECLCAVTAYELAYARAPKNMRALVVSLYLFNTALSSALAQAIIPVIKDPYLTWVWGGPAIALAVLTVHFYFTYRHMDNDEFFTEENNDVVSETVESKDDIDSEKVEEPAPKFQGRSEKIEKITA